MTGYKVVNLILRKNVEIKKWIDPFGGVVDVYEL